RPVHLARLHRDAPPEPSDRLWRRSSPGCWPTRPLAHAHGPGAAKRQGLIGFDPPRAISAPDFRKNGPVLLFPPQSSVGEAPRPKDGACPATGHRPPPPDRKIPGPDPVP